MHLLSAMNDQIAIAIAKAKMLEEIKSTQERLVKSEKLASLGQLFSSIEHEINNPLTPIVGYSQRLLMRPGLSEQLKVDSVFHSGRISDDIVAFINRR